MVMTLQNSDTQAHDYDEPDQDFSYLVATASELDLPGLSAEVFGGNIIVSPWSKGRYHKPMRSVIRQLDQHAPEGYEAGAEPFLFVFPEHAGAFGPDIWVADVDLIDIDSNRLPGEALSLVGEFTSPATRGNDLHEKVDFYGRAGVPVYLLFDMKEQRLTVYSDPSWKHGFQVQVTVDFGDPVQVPAPFDFALDTTDCKRKPV